MRWLAFLLLFVSSPAAAGSFSPLELETSYVGSGDPPEGHLDGLLLLGGRARAQFGYYRLGLDLHVGTTVPKGLAYDVAFYPAGVGVSLGPWSHVGVAIGVGASGARDTVDDALQLPVAAELDVALGPRLELLARGRISWLAYSDPRQDGAPLGDELEATLALRIGHRWFDGIGNAGFGWYGGLAYRAAEGDQMFGLVVGMSVAGY